MAKPRLLAAMVVLLLMSGCAGSNAGVDGRGALASAQGEPHILWFWGAN